MPRHCYAGLSLETDFLFFPVKCADSGKSATVAFGTAGSAYVTAVKYEPVMCSRKDFCRKIPDQFLFYAEWSGAALRNQT